MTPDTLSWVLIAVNFSISMALLYWNITYAREQQARLHEARRRLRVKTEALGKAYGLIQAWRRTVVFNGPLDEDPVSALLGEIWTAIKC